MKGIFQTYKIMKEIGQNKGQFGRVFLARRLATRQLVVLKLVPIGVRAEAEARALRKATSDRAPFTLRLIESGTCMVRLVSFPSTLARTFRISFLTSRLFLLSSKIRK
jgi:serine/threonine protein kinase